MIQPATAPFHPHWTPMPPGRNANLPLAGGRARAWPFMARSEPAQDREHKEPDWQDSGS